MGRESANTCLVCGKSRRLTAAFLSVCPACARTAQGAAMALDAHKRARQMFNLPVTPPRAVDGVRCTLCGAMCSIGEGDRGFCGLRENKDGRIYHIAGTPKRGLLHWYRDPLPTNCVADWVCKGSSFR